MCSNVKNTPPVFQKKGTYEIPNSVVIFNKNVLWCWYSQWSSVFTGIFPPVDFLITDKILNSKLCLDTYVCQHTNIYIYIYIYIYTQASCNQIKQGELVNDRSYILDLLRIQRLSDHRRWLGGGLTWCL